MSTTKHDPSSAMATASSLTPPPPAAAPAAGTGTSPTTATSPTAEELRAEVAALRRRLAAVEAGRSRVRRRRARVESQRQELQAWAAAWWGRVNTQAAALGAGRAALQALEREAEGKEARLRTLARTHVLDDAFFIWHAGPFVTINGLRLGRLPAVSNVDWSDVNGGLGLAVLLVTTAAERSGFRFRQHQLLPMGSFPKVAAGSSTSPPPPLPAPSLSSYTSLSLSLSSSNPTPPSTTSPNVSNLYYEDGFAFFRRQGFNRALQAFLRCVAEFGDFAERRDPTLRLPYRIQDGGTGGAGAPTVGGLPIVFAPGSEETWTRALKYLITDVKWLVAWSAKHTG